MSVQRFVQHQFTPVEVVHSHYPVAPLNMFAAQATSVAQFGLIGAMLVGEGVFRALNVPTPGWYNESVKPNSVPIMLGAWFAGGTLTQNLIKTGAFEGWFDGELIHSKKETGKMPTGASLYKKIKAIVEKKELAVKVKPYQK